MPNQPRDNLGQFAEKPEVSAGVSLAPERIPVLDPRRRYVRAKSATTDLIASPTERDYEFEDGLYYGTEWIGRAADPVAPLVRRLLGAPDDAKVTVTIGEHSVNMYGCDTWESYEDITIASGAKSLTFNNLPDLLHALDTAAHGGPHTQESLEPLRHTNVVFRTRQYPDTERRGELNNLSVRQFVIVGSERLTKYGYLSRESTLNPGKWVTTIGISDLIEVRPE